MGLSQGLTSRSRAANRARYMRSSRRKQIMTGRLALFALLALAILMPPDRPQPRMRSAARSSAAQPARSSAAHLAAAAVLRSVRSSVQRPEPPWRLRASAVQLLLLSECLLPAARRRHLRRRLAGLLQRWSASRARLSPRVMMRRHRAIMPASLPARPARALRPSIRATARSSIATAIAGVASELIAGMGWSPAKPTHCGFKL